MYVYKCSRWTATFICAYIHVCIQLPEYLAHEKRPPPSGLPQGPRHIPTLGSKGVALGPYPKP